MHTNSHKKDTTKNIICNILLFIAAIIWGFAFVFQKDAGNYLDPFSINMFRFFIGGLILIPACMGFDRARDNRRVLFSCKNPHILDISKAEWLGGSLCGVFLCLASNLQQFCLTETSPGKTAFLTALYSIFVPIFGFFRKKRVGLHVWSSVFIACGGAYLLTMFGENSTGFTVFDAILLLCSVIFAIHITIIDLFSCHVDGVRLSMVQFFVAGLLSLPFSLLFGNAPGDALVAALPSLLFLGIFSCGVGYTFQIIGQQMSGHPTVASLILSLESAFGVLGGYLFGMEPIMTIPQILGCILILGAVMFSQLPLGKNPKKTISTPPENTP